MGCLAGGGPCDCVDEAVVVCGGRLQWYTGVLLSEER